MVLLFIHVGFSTITVEVFVKISFGTLLSTWGKNTFTCTKPNSSLDSTKRQRQHSSAGIKLCFWVYKVISEALLAKNLACLISHATFLCSVSLKIFWENGEVQTKDEVARLKEYLQQMNCIKKFCVKNVIKKYLTNPAKLIEWTVQRWIQIWNLWFKQSAICRQLVRTKVQQWVSVVFCRCISASNVGDVVETDGIMNAEQYTLPGLTEVLPKRNQGENVEIFQITQEPDWKSQVLYTVKCLQLSVEAVQNKKSSGSLENYC